MKYLFIDLTVREGEREHNHRCLHTTTGENIRFAALRYMASFWDDEFSGRMDDWIFVHGGEIAIKLDRVQELTEFEYQLITKVFYGHSNTDYFKIKQTGFDTQIQREQIEISAGKHGEIHIFQDDDKLGFIIDVYDKHGDHHSTLPVWEEDLQERDISPDDIDLDNEGNCLYCGQKCFDGEMCDEQQAGGFSNLHNPEPENFSATEVEDFVDDWGQTHDEICSELGYDDEDDGSSEMLIGDGYIWFERFQKWFPKSSSMYDQREEKILEYLKLKYS